MTFLSVKILLGILAVLLLILLLFFLVLVWRTSKIQSDEREAEFLSGKLPPDPPDGFYKGTATKYKTSWLGKKFNSTDSTGINVFDNGKGEKFDKYSFVTYSAKGLLDKNLDVLKIDYNVRGNPFWLRFIVDEIVEVKPLSANKGEPVIILAK